MQEKFSNGELFHKSTTRPCVYFLLSVNACNLPLCAQLHTYDRIHRRIRTYMDAVDLYLQYANCIPNLMLPKYMNRQRVLTCEISSFKA